jgi:hypothetical protein
VGRKSRAKQQRRAAREQADTARPEAQVFDAELLAWTERLTGLEPERVRTAAEKVRGWRLPPVEAQLLQRPSMDTAVAITLLAEGVELLVEHGVQRTQLLAKLRRDPYPWPAWAEIRAASILVNVSHEDVRVTLEPGKSKGKQPDFRLVLPDAKEGMNVEFKAIGLSKREVEFCHRMGERLPTLVPPVGIVTGHAFDLDTPTIRRPASEVRFANEEAARRAADVPLFPDGFAAGVMVGHDSEESYLSRLQDRLRTAIEQLPLEEESWVAFHWTNGASVRSAFDAIDWATLPEHLAGVMFVGDAVVFPDPRIHVFTLAHPRGAERSEQLPMNSTLDDDYARLMLERVDATAGVRATLLRGRVGPGRSRQLLRRNGDPAILPFNLVLSGDPPEYGVRGDRKWPEEERLGEQAQR